MDDPVTYIREKLDLFFTIAQNDPIQAIKFVPEAAGGLAAVAVTILAVLIGVLSMGGSKAAPAVKQAAKNAKVSAADAKDRAAEAVASGTEQVKVEANKRATRSTS